MIASVQGLSFTASLAGGNPLHKIITISNTLDKKWRVRNVAPTPWIRTTPNGSFGDGFFDVSVNIYDPSVVIGLQVGILYIESIDPTIQIMINLNVSAT